MGTVLLMGLLLTGCKAPPPAPEGLDDSTTYLVRNFYADDLTFEAGVQGFVDWYASEGSALVGEAANLDTVDAYTIGDLAGDDVAHLPISDQILVDPKDEEYEPRDVTLAKGVVSLAEMDCTWLTAEAFLVRPDQHVVFSDDFEGYERTYVSSRDRFELGSAEGSYDKVRETLNPFEGDFPYGDYARSLLFTENMVDPTKVITANMDPYPMNLDMRHGSFVVDGEERGVLAILTYNIEAAWGSAGVNALLQSFSIELNVQQDDDSTLRMLAVWAQPQGGGIDPDSALALNYAVNRSLGASERLSEVCAGEVEIPAE